VIYINRGIYFFNKLKKGWGGGGGGGGEGGGKKDLFQHPFLVNILSFCHPKILANQNCYPDPIMA